MDTVNPFKYAINLQYFTDLFKSEHDCFSSIYRTLRSGETIEQIVKSLKIASKNAGNPYYFSDFNHNLFLPCLTNYLALINEEQILLLLNFYYDKFNRGEQKEMLEYLDEQHALIMGDYNHCFPDISAKIYLVRNWVESKKRNRVGAQKILIENKVQIFRLTELQIEAIILTFLDKNIIKEDEGKVVTAFFNNDFNKIELKTAKNIILDLFDRILFFDGYKKLYTKELVTQVFAEYISYWDTDNEEFTCMTKETISNGLEKERLQKIETLRILLNEFPEKIPPIPKINNPKRTI